MSAACLRPQKLLAARAARTRGDITVEQLRAAENEAICDAIKLQEEVGLRSVTDGEFRRDSWHIDFLEQFGNVAVIPSKIKARFQSERGPVEYSPPTIEVRGRLSRTHPIFVEDFMFVKSLVREKPNLTPKITIPSPSTMHFRGGRAAVDRRLIRRCRSSTPILPASITRRCWRSPPPAAAICSSTRSISPISATRRCASKSARRSAKTQRPCRAPMSA